MRVLIVGDSHGIGMENFLCQIDKELDVLNLSVSGGRIESLLSKLRENAGYLLSYRPDFVVFVLGHNAVMDHPNPAKRLPKDWGKQVVVEIMTIGIALDILMPGIQVFIACMYPRLPSTTLNESSSLAYNQLVVRLGRYAQQLRRNAISRGIWGFEVMFCRQLWNNIMLYRANEGMLSCRDGMHLNPRGKSCVAELWDSYFRNSWFEI